MLHAMMTCHVFEGHAYIWAKPCRNNTAKQPTLRSTMPSTRNRDRSRSPERDSSLPDGISSISESDYFLKNTEFRVWLKDEKDKVCARVRLYPSDTLSSPCILQTTVLR